MPENSNRLEKTVKRNMTTNDPIHVKFSADEARRSDGSLATTASIASGGWSVAKGGWRRTLQSFEMEGEKMGELITF